MEEQTHPLRTLHAEDGTLMHTCLRCMRRGESYKVQCIKWIVKGLAARGLDVVDTEEGQDGADEFG